MSRDHDATVPQENAAPAGAVSSELQTSCWLGRVARALGGVGSIGSGMDRKHGSPT